MRSSVIESLHKKSFEDVLSNVRANIVSNGFLLLHEINTQQIMETNGYKIPPLRQLLFFHPIYMKQILDADPLSVIEVPLKVLVREIDSEKVSVSYTNPMTNFTGYSLNNTLAEELLEKIRAIV